MTRYQFWPFVAYYNADRIDYLLELTENTYKVINGQLLRGGAALARLWPVAEGRYSRRVGHPGTRR